MGEPVCEIGDLPASMCAHCRGFVERSVWQPSRTEMPPAVRCGAPTPLASNVRQTCRLAPHDEQTRHLYSSPLLVVSW